MEIQTAEEFYKTCLAGVSERDMYMRVRAVLYTPQSFATAFDALGFGLDARVMEATNPIGDYFFVRTAGEPNTEQFRFAQAQGFIPSITSLRDNLGALRALPVEPNAPSP